MYTFKEYVIYEVLKQKHKFSWIKALKRIQNNREANYIFWYRAAYVLYRKNNFLADKLAKRINKRIRFKYCCDIHRESSIDIGFCIGHLSGIVINPKTKIGKNCKIRQNTTIGTVNDASSEGVVIGDNVNIGANSCIIGDGVRIGDNVTLGAMSFVNKDIESNTTYITKKESIKKQKQTACT
ncbi:serine O-acetyltransferase [Microbulbifer sp. 2205BS26-8]|uniref:serine O-acetyltransferase n=1 Tax=Microbulbifer sp. 2205BS26-8 TaxID=3064386 RepID=UPI00273E04CE|nr:DapH/DapD/GlmU-related protein [Microbulbifer sp. 2205BS26-8]MDP5209422.1 DapH/DapD/GlmU-related protein [Microbulbifer sp. 2205BS26-8]